MQRPRARADRAWRIVVSTDSANGKPGQLALGSADIVLFLEARRIHWGAVDWACTRAREASQRSLSVVLDCRTWWHLPDPDNTVLGETYTAWHDLSEALYDSVTERIWGWGLEPVILTLAGRTPVQVLTGRARPGLLVAGRPGRLSWLSRWLIRELRRRNWPVTLVG
jgi:hypothetical protein